MVHIPTTDEQAVQILTLVDRALGEDWKKSTLELFDEAIDTARTHIEYELEADLHGHIRSCAQMMAEAFIEAVMRGDEAECRKFIGDPPGWDDWQRKCLSSIDRDSPRHSPVALRKSMIEACGDMLKTEHMLDLEALAKQLSKRADAAETELVRWRTGEVGR